MKSDFDPAAEIRLLLGKKSNALCADCFDSCTLYIDMNNGLFLCNNCAEIHKQLGFQIKNPLTDNFTYEDIQKLKQTDNQTFNSKWMALFQSDSSKVPFGSSLQERQLFIYNKYIAKKWFSSTPNRSNVSFYNPRHFDIQEEDENDSNNDIDEPLIESNSETYDTSEITSPNEPNFFGFGQKESQVLCQDMSFSVSSNADHDEVANEEGGTNCGVLYNDDEDKFDDDGEQFELVDEDQDGDAFLGSYAQAAPGRLQRRQKKSETQRRVNRSNMRMAIPSPALPPHIQPRIFNQAQSPQTDQLPEEAEEPAAFISETQGELGQCQPSYGPIANDAQFNEFIISNQQVSQFNRPVSQSIPQVSQFNPQVSQSIPQVSQSIPQVSQSQSNNSQAYLFNQKHSRFRKSSTSFTDFASNKKIRRKENEEELNFSENGEFENYIENDRLHATEVLSSSLSDHNMKKQIFLREGIKLNECPNCFEIMCFIAAIILIVLFLYLFFF